jgi:hypothetical protein
MLEQWTTWWAWVFMKIAITEAVFSWSFVGLVLIVVAGYMTYLWFANPADQSVKNSIFRFRWKELMFGGAATVIGLLAVVALGISITLHSFAFAEGMENGCVTVEKTETAYEFTLPATCAKQKLLWNKVSLEAGEGQPAADFLASRKQIR